MNVVSLLKATEYIGAKELRLNLDRIMRRGARPYRVMLRNKPVLAILPDKQYLEILEILEELKDSGLLEKAREKLDRESREKNPWFWSASWRKSERAADRDLPAGRKKSFKSARELLKDLRR